MIAGGVSIKGKKHEQNQDSFWAHSDSDLTVLAISDGLGSCKYSHYGSQAFCNSVREIFSHKDSLQYSPEEMCSEIHKHWLQSLNGHQISDCYATALFAVYYNSTLTLCALGDGFIAAIYDESKKHILWDDKEDYFINETDCLQESFESSDWRIFQCKCDNLQALIASSDGMELYPDGEESILAFITGFSNGYTGNMKSEIEKDIQKWLSEWPGDDDKTVAYCIE